MRFSRRILPVLFFVSGLLLNAGAQDQSKQAFKYVQFLKYLNTYYVDSVDNEKLVEDAIKSHLQELDPHSTYISEEDVRKMNEPLKGNFEGVGISFNILKDTLFVITPVPGGPSEKVGIQSGDRIIRVDGKNIAGIGLTNEDVFSLLRGAKGTKVSVSVLRRSVDELIRFTITRDKIPINSLDASYIIKDGIGYIKLNRFSMTTISEFSSASKALIEQGTKDLILDLTGNAGGYLDIAVVLADQFLDDEKLIVYTQGLHSPKREYYASSKGYFEDGRVIILIDEGSASASEIVSGAIQDWDRGIIIGRRSFGKGLVQRQLALPDGSMVRLTSAKYYTPSGRLIQKPYEDGNEKYGKEIFNRYEHGEFMNRDSIQFPDSLNYHTLVSGRTVFGGGGIMPDIFVPLDTTSYSDYYSSLIRDGILNRFVLEYVDNNRMGMLDNYSDFRFFKENFLVTEKILGELSEFAEKEGLNYDETGFELSKSKIALTVKAYIARDLWSTSEFYQIINQDNNNLSKAVEVLDNWSKYSEKLLQ
ncbi:MAG: S41 family peptidase [Bacteroidales bacterium]|jgi:carboxyl-terminal processing protease